MNFWDDADIISMYTLQDAVRDGSLIPLSSMGDKIAALGREAGISYPCTASGDLKGWMYNILGVDGN